jgi:F0F1-type ATP synthase assembly protein I
VLIVRAAVGGLGLLCVFVGGVFIGQGVGVIGGSFMTGKSKWAVVGAVLVGIGVALLAVARFRDRSR